MKKVNFYLKFRRKGFTPHQNHWTNWLSYSVFTERPWRPLGTSNVDLENLPCEREPQDSPVTSIGWWDSEGTTSLGSIHEVNSQSRLGSEGRQERFHGLHTLGEVWSGRKSGHGGSVETTTVYLVCLVSRHGTGLRTGFFKTPFYCIKITIWRFKTRSMSPSLLTLYWWWKIKDISDVIMRRIVWYIVQITSDFTIQLQVDKPDSRQYLCKSLVTFKPFERKRDKQSYGPWNLLRRLLRRAYPFLYEGRTVT